MNLDTLAVNFIERENITFELRAINSDGTVLAKRTSGISADDLTGDAWKIDEAIDKLALDDEAQRRELNDISKEGSDE